MNRTIRIALTLFLSATILVMLTLRRANDLQNKIDAGLSEMAVQEETHMILVGILLAGSLTIGGFVLIIVSIMKARKKIATRHEG